MPDLPFVLNYIYFVEQHILEHCSILQSKHLAHKKSVENFRLNYISKKWGLMLDLVFIQ